MPAVKTQKYLLVSFCFLLCCAWQATQAQKTKLTFFTTAEGLAGNNTSWVTQGPKGFLWFINEGKLHRHDGKQFVVFNPTINGHLADESFLGTACYQDSLLFIWSEKSAFLYAPNTGKWKQLAIDTSILSEEETFYWHRMGADHILLNRGARGKDEASLVLFENGEFFPLKLPKQLCSLKNSLLNNTSYFLNYWCDIDSKGIVHLAYRDTLYKFDLTGALVNKIPLSPSCEDCFNICFRFTENDNLVLSVNWHFYLLDKAANQFVSHPANAFLKTKNTHLHRFIVEKNGSIWACGANRNLIYYDAPRDTLYNFHEDLVAYLQSANDFKGLFQDKTGVVWIDTRLGLLKVIPQPYPFETYLSGKNKGSAYYSFRGITENQKGEILGVFYNGIAKINPKEKKVARIYNFDHILNFYDLFTTKDKVWVNGGQFLDENSGLLKDVPSPFFNNPVSDNGFFAKDKNGRLWWFTHYMLFYLDTSTPQLKWVKEFELAGKIYNRSEALHYGQKSGLLWLNYLNNIISYNIETKERTVFSSEELGLPASRITALIENTNGTLWVGTDVGLSNVNVKTKRINHFTTAHGLPNNFICGLLPEGDSVIWVSTNHGLSRFKLKDESFLNFFEDDGLSHNEFNRKSYYTASNGKMYFGGMRGINAFYPSEIMQSYKNRSKTANLVLSSFEYADERFDTVIRTYTFEAKPELNLFYWDWSFNFEYALTDFSNPDEVFYSYKMEGYKESWSTPSKLNTARFNSLPIGEFVFKVKARDSRGHWHPNQLAVKIIVHPPWWRTTTAYVVYALAFLFWLRVFSKFRERRLIARQKLLKKIVNVRTAELVAEKKEVERQKHRSDELLRNILPEGVAEELKLTGKAEAQLYEEVSVMFTDFADFTKFAEKLTARELVAEIDACFQAFDEIINKYKLEKIKTIGDAYMCAGGLNRLGIGGPTAVVLAGIEMQEFIKKRNLAQSNINLSSFTMRVGIHTGQVVAGIVGVNKFQYDIWGDTVNTANRMESTSEIGKINISESTYRLIKDDAQFTFKFRGTIDVKGKGAVKMWFVNRAK